MEGAINDYPKHCGAPIVIKPKKNGFRIRSHIFSKEYDIEDYQRTYLHEKFNIAQAETVSTKPIQDAIKK
ncbi:hypothetical protein CYL18_17420 [Pradoshia eiseniae]|uniref:Uncharacterized protein n=1 Tax=Pradoshia eiseniae TaxID=2064768 RepID=A0A2S7MVQ9_9BACI|nr:hypothetical protein CYL18_17420 [Pradoshia eiseniae]